MKKKILFVLAGLLFLQFFGCHSVAPTALSNIKTIKIHVDMEIAMK